MVAIMQRILVALAISSAAQASAAAPVTATVTSAGASEAPRPIIIGQSYRIPSAILGGSRVINVQLPEHYGDAGRRFPVLYLLDGGEHEDFEHIAGLAQINAAYGQGQEMIVVGIEGVDRRHDLTSPSSVPGDLKSAPTSGGAEAYRRFLTEELRPWVQSRFRANGRTALIGESLAGLFVLETFLEQPETFSDYIAVSPSLWWNGGKVVSRARQNLRGASYAGKRLWIAFETPAPPVDAAAKDRALQRALEQAFRSRKSNGLNWTIVHSPNGHASIYHPAAVQAFRTLYGNPTS